MAGYATPAWANDQSPAIDDSALLDIGHGIEIAEHPYGVCSTAAGTAAKTVTIDYSGTLTLFTGLTVRVKFSNANTAANPTLNVNSTGAAAMVFGTGNAVDDAWIAGAVVQFTYDGTSWVVGQNLPISQMFASEIIKVNFGTLTGTGSSVTASKSNAKITASHDLIGYYIGTPTAQFGNLTVTTSAGAVSVSGAINGSTTLIVYLGLSGTSVT